MTELDEMRRAEPAWDEVRERRVLGRVLAAREAAQARGKRLRAGAAMGLAATVLVAGGWLIHGLGGGPAELATVAAPARPSGRLALSDGSAIELDEGAQIEVLEDAESSVRIAQHEGRVRYVVSHRPARTFSVACAEVEVVVRGTRFWVARDATGVTVDVEDGRVEVRRADGVTTLVRGESLRVAPTPPAEPEVPAVEPSEPEVPARAEAPAVRRRRDEPVHASEEPSIEALLDEADRARREHRLPDAAAALETAIARLGADARASVPLFMLGRLERSRGRHAVAAEAFLQAYERDPDSVLAEDALAEAAVSYADADLDTQARATAARYAVRFPDGHYVTRIRAALE